jgi:tetratricopeptide (TPR) repeat protein
MAVQLPRLNRLDEALASARKAVEIREKQVAQDPNNTRRQRMLMIALSHEGDNLGLPTRANLERYDEALAVNRRMLGIAQALADKDPHDKRLQLDVAFCLLRIGAVMSVKGPRAEARQTLLRALGILESLAANDPKNSAIQRNIVVVLDRLSRVEESEPAISHLAIAVAMSEAILKQDLKNQDVRAISFTAMRRYAEMLADAGNRAAAIEMAQKAITVANESATVAGTDFARAGYPAVAAFSRAVVHERLREPEEARKWFRLSEERWKELERQGKFTAFYRKERELTKKAISN